MLSNVVNKNEEYIRSAISNGIGASGVSSTLEDIMNRSDEFGKTPYQFKEAIKTIAEMKESGLNGNETYLSDLMNKSGDRILSALDEGIKSSEIVNALNSSISNSNNRDGKRHLSFLVNLVSRMKSKELKLSKTNTNQKVKVKE